MRWPALSALMVTATALGLVALKHWGPGGLYTFDGHGRALSDAVHGCLWLLFLTHVALAGIIWTQRAKWDEAEAAIFRFVGVKSIFWGFEALTVPSRDGVSLTDAFLLVAIFATTIDLDIRLVRRYVLLRRNEGSLP